MIMLQVNIAIPPANQQSNVVRVTGPANNVKGAVKALLERVGELDKEQEDRVCLKRSLFIRN